MTTQSQHQNELLHEGGILNVNQKFYSLLRSRYYWKSNTPLSFFIKTRSVYWTTTVVKMHVLPLTGTTSYYIWTFSLPAAVMTVASVISFNLALMTLKSLFRTFVTYDAIIYWTTTLVDILANGTVWWQLATTHGTAFFS